MSDLNGQTVAVTGATGFLGSHLVEELERRGARVIGVARRPERGEAGPSREWRRGDLTDVDSLAAAFEGCDAVVANAALAPGWSSPDDEAFVKANVLGTHNTLDATARAGVPRLIGISTVAVYQTSLRRVVDEQAPLRDPQGGFDWSIFTTDQRYARSKALAEQALWERGEQLGLEVTTLRPGPIYGPRDEKLTRRYANWMKRGVFFAPTVGIPHVFAPDVAVATAGALANPSSKGSAYNVTGETVSVYQVLSAWRKLRGGARLVPVPVPFALRYDDGAARRDLGYQPTPLEDAVARCAAWAHEG